MTKNRDFKKRARLFPAPVAASALAWARHWIEHAGTGGGGFRPLYAEFLELAASVTKQPGLKALARDYRALGTAWGAFATALLPDAVPALAAIRRAQDARHAAFCDGDLDALRAAEQRTRDAIAAAGAFDARTHYVALAEQLRAIVDAETACAERLAAASAD